MIGEPQADIAKFLIDSHYDACRLAEFLAMEAAWFEFLPHDNDTYIVAVQENMRGVAMNRLNSWNVPVRWAD